MLPAEQNTLLGRKRLRLSEMIATVTFLLPRVLFLSSLAILFSSFLPFSVSLRLQRLFFGRKTTDKKLGKRTESSAERCNRPVDASRPPQTNEILRITDSN
jgi:hypothetical protein